MTNRYQYAIMNTTKYERKEVSTMENFNLFINYIEVSKKTSAVIDSGCIPFVTRASSYEEARTQALEHAQAIARDYDKQQICFFFLISRP